MKAERLSWKKNDRKRETAWSILAPGYKNPHLNHKFSMSSPVKVLLVQPGERLWDLDGNSFRQAASWLDLTERGTPGPAEAAAPNIWTRSHGERASLSAQSSRVANLSYRGGKSRVQRHSWGWPEEKATQRGCLQLPVRLPAPASISATLCGWRRIAITSLTAPLI